MAKLTEEMKRSIVSHLAQFRSQSATARLVSEEFGVSIDRWQVRTYDPTCFRFVGANRWLILHEKVREEHVQRVSEIPIAHQAVRLLFLERMLEHERTEDKPRLQMKILEQAAKEVGGMYVGSKRSLPSELVPCRHFAKRAQPGPST